VFRHCLPEAASKLATRLCDNARPIEPQICLRSTEHASTARPEGVLSLAASGFAPGSNPKSGEDKQNPYPGIPVQNSRL
jgi:hypothetical protein